MRAGERVGGVDDSSNNWLGSAAATHPSRFREIPVRPSI